jgi:hypothetical protein
MLVLVFTAAEKAARPTSVTLGASVRVRVRVRV